MLKPYILPLLAKAADDLERGCWWEEKPIDNRLPWGWFTAAVFCNQQGRDYAARQAFAEWWAPAEYRNDGMRTSETANEKGVRLGRAATVAALREFVAAHSESAAA